MICTSKEFMDLVGPKVINSIPAMTKKSKIQLEYKCQKCNEKKELDAAHKHGSSRRDIIKKVLLNYKIGNDQYEIEDLQKIINEIKDAHLPIEEHFIFLCKVCHREYDSWTKNLPGIKPKENRVESARLDGMQQQHTVNLSSIKPKENETESKRSNVIPQQIQESQNQNIKYSGPVTEKLCENEANSWKYKMGWTTIKNKRDIKGLISKIESSFDCYPIASKSWYYHNRRDSRKQFSGIICHKDRSVICFRVDPRSFDITDSRIMHGKRWFFSEGKEKRIDIIPENYSLILQCLSYAYQISR